MTRPPPDSPTVLVIGTMDTKGVELTWVAERIRAFGCGADILDCGILGTCDFPVAFSRAQVAEAAGTSLAELSQLERGDAIARMAQGVKVIALRAVDTKQIDAALCLAGAGASLATSTFQAMPIGFPRLIVSPLASGPRTMGMYVGIADVAVMHSVADIMGLNRITRLIFDEAAAYMAGAARGYRLNSRRLVQDAGLAVVASMNGNTTPAIDIVRRLLEDRGVELTAFHANGVGGRAMEQLIGAGSFDAVLDFTTTEVAADVFGGPMSAGEHRMEAAGLHGVPQVVVPGCADFVTLGAYDEVAAKYPGRSLYRHNDAFTLLRLTSDEMGLVATRFAEKLRLARGPVSVLIPTGGLSIPNYPGGPFWDPEADGTFVDALLRALPTSISTEQVDCHINDPDFSRRVVDVLLHLVTLDGKVPHLKQSEATT